MIEPPKVLKSFRLDSVPAWKTQATAQREAVELAEFFMREGDEVRPLFVVVSESVLNRDGPLVMFVRTDWADETEKSAHFWAMAKAMKAFNTTRYSFMCEVWAAEYNADEADDPERPQPSQHPNARDGLLVITCEKGKKPLSAMYDVVYDTSGKAVRKFLVPSSKQYQEGTISGRLTKLLDE